MPLENPGERLRGELAALAAVEDFRQAWFRRACPRQSTQNPPSSVFDTRHASTLREYQSITAAR